MRRQPSSESSNGAGGVCKWSVRLPRAFALLPLLLLVTTAVSAADNATFKAGVFNPPRQAPDFALRGSDGSELRLGRYRGKVVVLAFGFTHCPEICPTTLATLVEARRKLGAAADDVRIVFVTVDPERDDVARMKTYLASFDPTFVGATGTDEQLAAVRQGYGVVSEKKRSLFGETWFAHSSFTVLIDRAGDLRALMPYGRAPDDYVHDVRLLLGERSVALE